MNADIQEELLGAEQIQQRVSALAAEINTVYGTQPLTLVMLLKGALLFTADLCRHLTMPLEIECLSVASYHGGTESTGTVQFLDRELPGLAGKHVLVIDDILDTGQTLAAVRDALAAGQPASLRSGVLLSKSKVRATQVQAEFIGFSIEDEFVVGYGLDYKGLYRNLPYIGVLKQEAQ